MDHLHFRFGHILKRVGIILFPKRACLELLVVECKGCVYIYHEIVEQHDILPKLDQDGSWI